ncbi:MAG: DegT/DnrJ/EryC1/StrS family aminotransferase [Geminicoccaceae bacterium]
MPITVPFIDIKAQQTRIQDRLDERLAAVLAHGKYIMGPEVAELEAELSAFCGAPQTLTCSSGTDALLLPLKALDLASGDAVLVPTFTFAATAEVVAWLGATPVFIDIDADSFNIDPDGLQGGLDAAHRAGLNPVGIIAVDLFGRPADYNAINSFAQAHGMWVIADAAQSFGASIGERKVGELAPITTTSFFPAKPLACFGDGGAVFTDDSELAQIMASLRVHGQGQDKYDNVRIGMNARLDTIQAAVLLSKLEIFKDEVEARNRIAEAYNERLKDTVIVPGLPADTTSAWAQYTIRSPKRDLIKNHLAEVGIPSVVYYVKPLHQQTAYRDFPVAGNGCPVAERASLEVLSLPMHPYLQPEVQDRIAATIRTAVTVG